MSDGLLLWSLKGFSSPPTMKLAPPDGVIIYRCWGGDSTEWGNHYAGYFSLNKPTSVLDAELRFNIVDWGNRIFFVSTFRLVPRSKYWEGDVYHRQSDLRRPATQIYLEAPVANKLRLLVSREPLRQDVHVLTRPYPAKDRWS